MIPKPIRTVSPMPAPSLPHSASLPPTSFRAAQSTPSQPIRPNRRQSDRIRSPSDSSESESDEDTTARSTQPKTTQPKSAPFPPSGIPVPVGHRPFPPVRQKTLSDSSRLDSPLAARFRNGTGPPSAFGGAGGFARPSPANRRRRGSAGGTHAADTNGMTSPNFGAARPFGRSTSSSSLGMTRPLWKEKSQSQPTSPISPTHALDHTSFHLRAATPEEGRDGVDLVKNHVQPARQIRDDDGEVDEVDADIVRQDLSIIGPLDPRLSRISVRSTAAIVREMLILI